MSQFDQEMMQEALQEARKGYHFGEVPVGAIVVYQKEIISRAFNEVESRRDATAHAEVLAIRRASKKLGNWRLSGCTLYITLEPCSMCAGAILLARVDRIVWGAPDIRHGAAGSFVNLFEENHPTHRVELAPSVCGEQCAKLMKDFFKERRKERRKEKKNGL